MDIPTEPYINALVNFFSDNNVEVALQYIAWIAVTIGAWIAAINLRRTAKQASANFLLSLNPLWENLKNVRHEMALLNMDVTERVKNSQDGFRKDKQRLEALCDEYKKKIQEMETTQDGRDKIRNLYNYLNFFELVGLMVRKNYIKLKDIYLLYKGPIVEIDHAFQATIPQWQERFDLPEGLYENLLYLIIKVRRYEKLESFLRRIGLWKLM